MYLYTTCISLCRCCIILHYSAGGASVFRSSMAACVICLITLCGCGGGGGSSSIGPSEQIMFMRSYGLYAMNEDGSDVRLLSNVLTYGFSLSPDGSKITYESIRDDMNGEIYIANLDGTGVQRLTSHLGPDGGPVFSPDGTKIVFTSLRDSEYGIFSMNVDGTGLTRLANGQYGGLQFGPDGRHIVYNSYRDGKNDIYIMDADGSNERRLTYTERDAYVPRFSPDGSKIVFHSYSEDSFNDEIYVMDADGSNIRLVTQADSNGRDPAFNSDGTKIVFVNQFGIWVINTDGTNARRITREMDGAPVWVKRL